MNHTAIYAAYPQVVRIDDSTGAYDKDENVVQVEESKVAEAEKKLKEQQDLETQSIAAAKQALLDRLGITADEARLLLS